MNKELEKQLLEKTLKYMDKYPLKDWSEHYDYDYDVTFVSPDKKISICVDRTLLIKLNPLDEDYDNREFFSVFELPLAQTIIDLILKEKNRRKEAFLLTIQEKEKRILDNFLNSPI